MSDSTPDISAVVEEKKARRARHGKERRFNFWEQLYIPEILKGLVETFKVAFSKTFTIDYRGPKTDDANRFKSENGYRGEHYLKRHENGMEKCVACYMCSTACPAQCIEIDAEEAPADEFGLERFKRPAVFNIDMLKCIYCGYCVEACPKDAIGMTTTYNQVGRKREDFVYDKARLLRNNDEYMQKNALTAWGQADDGSYPFSPDGCGPEVTHGMDSYRVAHRLHELAHGANDHESKGKVAIREHAKV